MTAITTLTPRLMRTVSLSVALLILATHANIFGHDPALGLQTKGGARDNPFTVFDGGGGPGVCSIQGMPNYWVNTASQLLVVQDVDFAYRGLGPSIAMTRTYNMRDTRDGIASGLFGNNWTFSYESTIDHSGQTNSRKSVVLNRGSGQGLTYFVDLSQASPAQATSEIGSTERLTWYGSYWLFSKKESRLTYRYDRVAGSNVSRLTSISDLDGNTVTIDYNSDGTIKTITDASGRKISLAYNSNKRCISLSTPDGRQATFEYNAAGDMTKSVDLLGSATTYLYDAAHVMTALTAAGRSAQFEKAFDRIVTFTDARGNSTRYETDFYGTVIATDPAGGVRRYGNTGLEGWTNGASFGSTNDSSVGGFGVYFNPTLGLPESLRDARGTTTSLSYDAKGNPTEITRRHADDNILFTRTSYAYDGNDNLISMTNPLGEKDSYSWDAKRHLTRIRSPLGKETSMTYDARGQLTSLTNPAGHTSTFSYDQFGNLKSFIDPLGSATSFSYDPAGLHMTSRTDARGNTTAYEYDKNDRLTKITHPDGTTRSYTYDCCAATSVKDENGHTTTVVRDAAMNLTQLTDPMGRVSRRAYDKNGNLTSETDPRGTPRSRTYDAANRLTSTTDAAGGTTRFAYDETGNLVSFKNARGKETTFTYDYDDLATSTTDPLGKTVKLRKDALSRIAAVTNARGGVVAFSYDADGRVVKKTYDGADAGAYGYDEAGNLTSVTDGTGTTTYAYNALREVTDIRYPTGKAVSISYDAAGNISSIIYPNSFSVRYAYDKRNRVSSVAWDGNSVSYTYDGLGNLVREARSNGTESSFAYNDANEVTSIQHRKAASAFAQVTYTRDEIGRIVKEERQLPATTAVSPQSSVVTINDADQIVTWGSDTYSYDSDGNLSSITGSRQITARYDQENRLTSIIRNGVTTSFLYDGVGYRTKTVTGSEARNCHFDTYGRLLFETDGAGNVVSYYIYAGARLTAMRLPSGASYFYHFNNVGSTIALTDGEGSTAAAYSYTPFGEQAKQTGISGNPFTWVGAYGVVDDGDGLLFMKARHYDARSRRFLQRDPIGLAGGNNLYRYVENDPVRKADPSGLGLFGLGPGITGVNSATGMQWLKEGFTILRRVAKVPGKEIGDVIIKLVPKTFSPANPATTSTATRLSLHLARYGSTAAGETVVATAAEGTVTVTSLSQAGAGLLAAITYVGWMTVGGTFSEVGANMGWVDAATTGEAMIGAGCDPDYWNTAKNYYGKGKFTKDVGYFWGGLKEKIFGADE
ncbi:MAG: RHS repeat protein [Acidobacteria bacterium]|nr:RHS repeat protein [Acidobacteriota bacterium]